MIKSLPLAIPIVLSVWAVSFVLLAGCGILVARCFRLNAEYRDAEACIKAFWLGWAFVIYILQIWNFFLPVDFRALILVSVAGVSGFVWNWKRIHFDSGEKSVRHYVMLLVLLPVIITIAKVAILPPSTYDSGLYHLNMVRWINSFPVVNGLGNLHGRLAFNNSHFLYVALLEFPGGKAHHFANSLLLAVAVSQICLKGLSIFWSSRKCSFGSFFAASLLYPALGLIIWDQVSSPATDLPNFVLGIVLTVQLVTWLDNPARAKESAGYDLFLIVTLAVVGVTVKISSVILGLASVSVAILTLFAGSRSADVKYLMIILGKVILCAVIGLAPWMIRSVMLSGYPLYPSSILPFPVDWRIPLASVEVMQKSIFVGSRYGAGSWSTELNTWAWLGPWLKEVRSEPWAMIPCCLTMAGIVLMFISVIFTRLRGRLNPAVYLFLVPLLLAVDWWFFTAPEVGFAGATLYLLGIGLVGLALYRIFYNRPEILRWLLILYFGFCLTGFLRRAIRYTVPKGDDVFGFHRTAKASMNTFVTRSGLKVFVPVNPARDDRSWDSQLPATSYPNSNLCLRCNNDMSRGFTVNPWSDSDPAVGMW